MKKKQQIINDNNRKECKYHLCVTSACFCGGNKRENEWGVKNGGSGTLRAVMQRFEKESGENDDRRKAGGVGTIGVGIIVRHFATND
ncbi:MAG: hypothetical protein ACRYE7_00115 [Janthinobacterium lividum]